MSGCTSTYGVTVTHRCILPPVHDGDHKCRHGRTWTDQGSTRDPLPQPVTDACYGEIAELQDLAEHIDRGDVELLQWAGASEATDADVLREVGMSTAADDLDEEMGGAF